MIKTNPKMALFLFLKQKINQKYAVKINLKILRLNEWLCSKTVRSLMAHLSLLILSTRNLYPRNPKADLKSFKTLIKVSSFLQVLLKNDFPTPTEILYRRNFKQMIIITIKINLYISSICIEKIKMVALFINFIIYESHLHTLLQVSTTVSLKELFCRT